MSTASSVSPAPAVLRVAVKHVAAKCPECGCTRFTLSSPWRACAGAYSCIDCGSRTSRNELLVQICDEVLRGTPEVKNT